MICSLKGGQLRDAIPMVISFTKRVTVPLISLISNGDKYSFTSKDIISWNFISGAELMNFPIGCSFQMSAMESFLLTSKPEKFKESLVRLVVGEKEYQRIPILGAPSLTNPEFFYRNSHMVLDKRDANKKVVRLEDFEVVTFHPLQNFSLMLLNLPAQSFSIQINFIGILFRPLQ